MLLFSLSPVLFAFHNKLYTQRERKKRTEIAIEVSMGQQSAIQYKDEHKRTSKNREKEAKRIKYNDDADAGKNMDKKISSCDCNRIKCDASKGSINVKQKIDGQIE